MKYLKLFEQFEDDEDGWWDEESPFDAIKDLKVVKHGTNDFYLAKMIDEKNCKLYDDEHNDYGTHIFDMKPVYFDDTLVLIFFKNGNNAKFKVENLPKEIKDRVDLSQKSYH